MRICKPGGVVLISLPHRDLYERKKTLPSRWNQDHRYFYLPNRCEPPHTFSVEGVLRAAGVDGILAAVRGESLPLPDAQAAGTGGDWRDAIVFLLFGIPMLAGLLRNAFGHRAGIALTGVAAGLLGWVLTSVLWVAIGAALLGLVVAFLGKAFPVSGSRGRGGWGPPGGGWGGGAGGGGGFRSGGGGNFGGGGASGRW